MRDTNIGDTEVKSKFFFSFSTFLFLAVAVFLFFFYFSLFDSCSFSFLFLLLSFWQLQFFFSFSTFLFLTVAVAVFLFFFNFSLFGRCNVLVERRPFFSCLWEGSGGRKLQTGGIFCLNLMFEFVHSFKLFNH